MPDPWYPLAEDYYVPESEATLYPTRQGDVFAAAPETGPVADWIGFVVLSPSCEVQRKNVPVQVARVHRISELRNDFQRTAVTYGFDTREPGVVRVAFAHTFWLPPAADEGPLSDALFVDFRQTATTDPGSVGRERRERTLTHDARVHFIRRKLFYRYRWMLSLEDVRSLESARISADRDFAGPRPTWAQLPPEGS